MWWKLFEQMKTLYTHITALPKPMIRNAGKGLNNQNVTGNKLLNKQKNSRCMHSEKYPHVEYLRRLTTISLKFYDFFQTV